MADLMQWLLQDLKWEVFHHPPYSPDLAPSHFHSFSGFKKHFGGCNSGSSDNLQPIYTDFFKNQEAL